MTIEPYYQRQKCSPVTSFWKYNVYGDIRGGSLWRVRQMIVGSSTVIFVDLGGYFFANVRDKDSNITRRYATLVGQ